jgi:myosin-1
VTIDKFKVIKNYQGRYFFEEPPHVYAIAENAYHSLLNTGINQCIIITYVKGLITF